MGSYSRLSKAVVVFLIAAAVCIPWPAGSAGAEEMQMAQKPHSFPRDNSMKEPSVDSFMNSEFYGGGQALNLIKQLRLDCARLELRLTHETNTEDLDGNRSTSFYVNGDPQHYVVFYRFNKESTRQTKIRSLYGTEKNSSSPLIRTAGKLAFVYVSSGKDKNKYSDRLEQVFDTLVGEAE